MTVRQRNERLAALVRETGMPYLALANRINLLGNKENLKLSYGKSAVCQWITRGTIPTDPCVRDVVADILSQKLKREIRAEDIWPETDEPSPDATEYATLASMDRRTVLRLLGQALGGLVIVKDADLGRLVKPAQGLAKADAAGIEVLRDGIAYARRLDDNFGSRAAARPALAQYQLVTKLLSRSHPDDIERQLWASAGELKQFLGWLAFDLNDPTQAQAHLYEGMHAARKADDDQLASYILGYLAIVAIYDGRPTEGLALVETAEEHAKRKATTNTRSWLATVTGEAHANLREVNDTTAALGRAERLYRTEKRNDDPSWLYHYDRSDITSAAGTCWLVLGHAEQARTAMQETLALSGPSFLREQSVYMARLGESYVLDGDIATACDLAGQALNIASETESARGVQRVRELRDLFPQERANDPAVRELDERLRDGTFRVE